MSDCSRMQYKANYDFKIKIKSQNQSSTFGIRSNDLRQTRLLGTTAFALDEIIQKKWSDALHRPSSTIVSEFDLQGQLFVLFVQEILGHIRKLAHDFS
jgi:hypothetical protein